MRRERKEETDGGRTVKKETEAAPRGHLAGRTEGRERGGGRGGGAAGRAGPGGILGRQGELV